MPNQTPQTGVRVPPKLEADAREASPALAEVPAAVLLRAGLALLALLAEEGAATVADIAAALARATETTDRRKVGRPRLADRQPEHH